MGLYDNEEYRSMKRYVINEYKSPSWTWRVEHMRPAQVIAIYNSIRERKKKNKIKERDKLFKQVSLFDLYPEVMIQ